MPQLKGPSSVIEVECSLHAFRIYLRRTFLVILRFCVFCRIGRFARFVKMGLERNDMHRGRHLSLQMYSPAYTEAGEIFAKRTTGTLPSEPAKIRLDKYPVRILTELTFPADTQYSRSNKFDQYWLAREFAA